MSLTESLTPPVGPETCDVRTRWMAQAGVATSLWFIIVIPSFEAPLLMLPACR